MKQELITTEGVLEFLTQRAQQEVIYASCMGNGVLLRFICLPATGVYEVTERAGYETTARLLYDGTSLESAVSVYNRNSF